MRSSRSGDAWPIRRLICKRTSPILASEPILRTLRTRSNILQRRMLAEFWDQSAAAGTPFSRRPSAGKESACTSSNGSRARPASVRPEEAHQDMNERSRRSPQASHSEGYAQLRSGLNLKPYRLIAKNGKKAVSSPRSYIPTAPRSPLAANALQGGDG